MRWDEQTVEREAGARLPGYRDVTVRHFDAPEAVDTRFYEVEAKSILNHVPPASQMPFRWTINPYRGCLHACSFCIGGETPILMTDGRHKPLANLEVGDALYGTAYEGRYRRYVATQVLDRWISVKPAFRVTLAEGTELIASGDHRFLSNRGWKHVTNAPEQRPHLTPQNRLVGTGAFAMQYEETPDYRRGYLTGMIRGDGGRLGAVSRRTEVASRTVFDLLWRIPRRCRERAVISSPRRSRRVCASSRPRPSAAGR